MNILKNIPYDKIVNIPVYQRWIAAGVIYVIIAVSFYFFSYQGKVSQAKGIEGKIANLETEIKKNRLRANQLANLMEKVDDLNFRLLVARTQLPDNKEVPDLLENISNLGKSSGLEFLLFKPLAVSPKDFYTDIPVQMILSGTFHDTTTFFDKLGNFSRIVNVGNISMEAAKSERKNTIIKTASDITTFMYTGGKDIEDDKKSYLNNKFGVSVRYKKEWTIDDTSSDAVVILKTAQSKKGYINTIQIKNIAEDISMNDLIGKDKKENEIFKSDYKVISEGKLNEISGFTAYDITYSYTKDKEHLTDKIIYISTDTDHKLFKIICNSLSEEFNTYESIFNDVIKSFWIHTTDDFRKIGEERLWMMPESTYNPQGKRDPFSSLIIAEKDLMPTEIIDEDGRERKIKTPLEMFDILSLKLSAIIWDSGHNNGIALIETSDGKGYVVKKNDVIGKKNGIVRDITTNSVIVEQSRKYRIGDKIEIKKETITLKLKSSEG